MHPHLTQWPRCGQFICGAYFTECCQLFEAVAFLWFDYLFQSPRWVATFYFLKSTFAVFLPKAGFTGVVSLFIPPMLLKLPRAMFCASHLGHSDD